MFGGFGFGGFGGAGGGFRSFSSEMPGGMPGAGARERKEVNTSKLYEALGVDKSATTSQIKKAYLKLARKEHPDKGGDPEKFKTIQHAYDILGDEEKRQLYDEGGEDAVETGGARGSSSDIFDMFFGGGGRRARGPRKAEPNVSPLEVSLEDLYVGKTIRTAGSRTIIERNNSGDIMDQSGQRYSRRSERKMFTVEVEKGMRDGQKITFEGEGDVMPGQEPGDMVFVIKTKDNAQFSRKGADLVMKKEISLYEALTGISFVIHHLDNHKVHVVSQPGEVTGHESIRQVQDEGMPIYGNSFMKGCLFIHFEVKFPTKLEVTDAQRKALAGILGDVPPPVNLPEDEHIETKEMEEVNLQARRDRERIGQDAAESDSEGGPGGAGVQHVQCAQQ